MDSTGVEILTKRLPFKLWIIVRRKIITRDNFKCQICKTYKPSFNALEVDHILPLSKGGTNKFNNLRTLCEECHTQETVNDFPNYPTYSTNKIPTQPKAARKYNPIMCPYCLTKFNRTKLYSAHLRSPKNKKCPLNTNYQVSNPL